MHYLEEVTTVDVCKLYSFIAKLFEFDHYLDGTQCILAIKHNVFAKILIGKLIRSPTLQVGHLCKLSLLFSQKTLKTIRPAIKLEKGKVGL